MRGSWPPSKPPSGAQRGRRLEPGREGPPSARRTVDPTRRPGSRAHLGRRGRPRGSTRARRVRLPGVAVRGRRAAGDPGPLGGAAAARAREGRRARARPDLRARRRPARQREQRQQDHQRERGAAPTGRPQRGRSHVVPGAT